MCCMQLEKKTDEVEQFYNSTNDQVNNSKDKVQEKHLIGTKKPSQGVPSREAVASESQELMHHFSSILHKASPNTLLVISIISKVYHGIKMESCNYMGN